MSQNQIDIPKTLYFGKDGATARAFQQLCNVITAFNLQVNSNVASANISFVPYAGATKDVDMGRHGLIMTASDGARVKMTVILLGKDNAGNNIYGPTFTAL